MRRVNIVYYSSSDFGPDGIPKPGVTPAPLTVVPSDLRFQLFYCLKDFAFRVARERPHLRGKRVEVVVDLQPNGSITYRPTLRLDHDLTVDYPVSALRGGETVPRSLMGQNLLYGVQPGNDDCGPMDDILMEETGEGALEDGALTVQVPEISAVSMGRPRGFLVGADHAASDDVPVLLPWEDIRAWAMDLGRRLRAGEAFVEEGLLGGGALVHHEAAGVIHVVRTLLPAEATATSAASLTFTGESYARHQNKLDALNRASGGPPLSRTAWAHCHHCRWLVEAGPLGQVETAQDAARQRGPSCEESPRGQSGLFFSAFDVRVHRMSYADPWSVAIVLDAAVAEASPDPDPADADRLVAVYGWWKGHICRRAAAMVTDWA